MGKKKIRQPKSEKVPKYNDFLKKNLYGWSHIQASGGQLYSFINDIYTYKINCKSQNCKDDIFQCYIYSKDYKKLRKFADTYNVDLKRKELFTLHYFIYRNRFRFGIPIGFLLSCILLLYCCNIVMIIDIQGNNNISDEKIYSILKLAGIKKGTFIGDIDFSHCENILYTNIEELSLVSIRHTGNRIVVEVAESQEKPEMLLERIPCNIVSAYNAYITEVSVQCGQLMKLVGEPVQKGELLVSGVQFDSTGHITLRHSLAKIIGTYTIEQSFSCPYIQEIRTKTGNEIHQKYLNFLSLKFPLKKDSNNFLDYNLYEKNIPLMIFGKKLPISIEQTVYQEYDTTQIEYNSDEAKLNLKEQKERYEKNFLSDVEIINQKLIEKKTETAIEWTVSYTVSGDIGETKELYLK